MQVHREQEMQGSTKLKLQQLTQKTAPSWSSEQLKVLVFSKKCSWHLSSLLSNANFSRRVLALMPSVCLAWWLCLCRAPGCSQSKVRGLISAGHRQRGALRSRTAEPCCQQICLSTTAHWGHPDTCSTVCLQHFRTLTVGVCERRVRFSQHWAAVRGLL